jgi:coenzyme F420-reducing hydrogenase alpha subunit
MSNIDRQRVEKAEERAKEAEERAEHAEERAAKAEERAQQAEERAEATHYRDLEPRPMDHKTSDTMFMIDSDGGRDPEGGGPE